MKVLFVMPLAERLGGAENILWSFLQHVDRRRVEPALVFFEDGAFRREAAGIGIKTYVARPERARRPRILLFPPLLARVVRRERPDLLFSWLVEAQPFTAVAGILTGMARRVVWWQANQPRADFWERVATALPSRVVFMYSHATAAVQRAIWPHRETVVVHPGIDPPEDVDEADAARLREEVGLQPGRPVVGIVGRLGAWKGQHHVLRALALLRERGHDVHGLLVGGNAFNLEPEYEPYLRRLVSELGLDGSVTFTGQVPDGARYMRLMDVVVNASDLEPFGIVVLEAMARGVPVVAVNAGGPAEILEDGVSGLLVPSPDPQHFAAAFEQLLGDPAKRAELAENAQRRFRERFTVERMVEDLTVAIERVAGDPCKERWGAAGR